MIHPDTTAFLSGLFGQCGAWNQSSYITLTAIHPRGTLPVPSRHVQLGRADWLSAALEKLAHANTLGWGAYMGIALRAYHLGRWRRGGKSDLAVLPALFVDVDDPPLTLLTLPICQHYPPSSVVRSGKGNHLYWILSQPTQEFRLAETVMRWLGQELNADPCISVAHSMRLPGTVNTKVGRGGLCHLVLHHPERLYDLDAFHIPKEEQPRSTKPIQRSYPATYPHADNAALRNQIADALIRDYGGYLKHGRFIAARCPCGHTVDRPGMHFSYCITTGTGQCFGRHRRLDLGELCTLLGLNPT